MFRKYDKGNQVIRKCPKCDADLTKEDIDIGIFTRQASHWTYTCVKCKSIIGFAIR